MVAEVRPCGMIESGKRGTNIYAFVGEAWWDGGAFFFGFGEEDREFLDGGHGYVAAIVAREEGLSMKLVSFCSISSLFLAG